MKVAVIGSRGLTIDNLGKYLPEETTEIVSGAAKGVDANAREYALSHNIKLTEFLPDYKRYINSNLLYSRELGVYQDTTKTATSDRTVRLPAEISDLLKEYRQYWEQLRSSYGSKWNYFINIPDGKGVEHKEKADFLFIREDGAKIGYPINPDSITDWFNKFSERHGLPHINPHAFRHTLASVLCLNGVDMTTISKWLGHKNVTTTVNVSYGHTHQSSYIRYNNIRKTGLIHCNIVY